MILGDRCHRRISGYRGDSQTRAQRRVNSRNPLSPAEPLLRPCAGALAPGNVPWVQLFWSELPPEAAAGRCVFMIGVSKPRHPDHEPDSRRLPESSRPEVQQHLDTNDSDGSAPTPGQQRGFSAVVWCRPAVAPRTCRRRPRRRSEAPPCSAGPRLSPWPPRGPLAAHRSHPRRLASLQKSRTDRTWVRFARSPGTGVAATQGNNPGQRQHSPNVAAPTATPGQR